MDLLVGVSPTTVNEGLNFLDNDQQDDNCVYDATEGPSFTTSFTSGFTPGNDARGPHQACTIRRKVITQLNHHTSAMVEGESQVMRRDNQPAMQRPR